MRDGLSRLDDRLIRTIGVCWLRATRERAIHERCRYALSVMDEFVPQGPTVLDVGCGSGVLYRYLGAHRRDVVGYTGIDLYAERLNERFRGMLPPHAFRNVDLDGAWSAPPCDFAWASEVLEHLIDDSGVLARIAACLKTGALVAVTMPSLAFIRRVAERYPEALNVSETQDGGHVRSGYTSDGIRTLAEAAGLELLRIDAVSPRTTFEFGMRFEGPRGLRQIVDRLPLSAKPAWLRDAGDDALSHYYSIAAVMRKPGN